ncbi:unnamed protein product, partial [Iphiclides podalirius]
MCLGNLKYSPKYDDVIFRRVLRAPQSGVMSLRTSPRFVGGLYDEKCNCVHRACGRADFPMPSDNPKTEDQLPFEETLEKTGNGVYNILLAATCALSLLAIGADLFGFSLVVAAACDLELTVARKGILTSMPFIGILLVSYIWGYYLQPRNQLDRSGRAQVLSVCFSCAANSVSYTLVGESCIARVRNKYMVMMTCFILLSPAFAAVLTYPILKLQFEVPISLLGIVFRPWRLLNIALAVPSGLGAVAVYFFRESPKFLANCGRREEALDVMRTIYAVNYSSSKQDFGVSSFTVMETEKKKLSLFRAIYEQSAPLFRAPYLRRTLQLYYIVAIVFITNNSFLVWLPHILNLIRVSMQTHSMTGNICTLISSDQPSIAVNSTANEPATDGTLRKSRLTRASEPSRTTRKLMIGILCLSSVSGFLVSVTPEPVSSVVLFMVFTSTCLGMGILASYFVDQYPTSYRGMVACLSIMVGRSSSFVVLSSVVAAWFLPPDKPSEPTEKTSKL